MSEITELKTLIQGMQAELETTAKNATIEDLIRKIDEKDAKIADLTRRVDLLEGRIAVAENANTLLLQKHDDLESYTRRQNLRIVGIPEPEEGREDGAVCIEKVKEEIAKLDIHLDLDVAIDRAHRVGPKTDRQGKPVQRAMIVRFTSWRARTHVYTNRKKNKGDGGRFYLDLTKRRFDLKKKAEEKIKDNPKVKFAYADVNNNICLMLSNDTKRILNSETELDTILASI